VRSRVADPTEGQFKLTILGRTLEHLGVQMYKQRSLAIAELVANCWDADATAVTITLPESSTYNPATSTIVIEDEGAGMSTAGVETDFLVIGRNRRASAEGEAAASAADGSGAKASASSVGASRDGGQRRVMGRKGIGKLAGFGIAEEMDILTWRDGRATHFHLDVLELKATPGDVKDFPIPYTIEDPPQDSPHGTRITLRRLKHATPPDSASLIETLARRFSRTVWGSMTMAVNGAVVKEPDIELESRDPEEPGGWHEETLPDGNRVRWWAAFSKTVLHSTELRGFTVYANNKTAQAPPFFFKAEASMSGQHGTRYMMGAIEADFIDEGSSDDDIISTDRQEVDWDDASVSALFRWGEELTRKAVREWSNRRGERAESWVLANSGLKDRLGRLGPMEGKARTIIRSLGTAEEDPDRLLELAGALIGAFEYREFHDFVEEIDRVASDNDPEALRQLLAKLADWKVLESRAILEIVRGRIQIADKFHSMIANDAPERAPKIGDDNLHDLLASYPWLLDPEWQVLAEERRISKQLWDWALPDLVSQMSEEEARSRFDFIALEDAGKLLVIEIKRPGHAVEHEELHRLLRYRENLGKARERVEAVLVSGGHYNFDISGYATNPQLLLLVWSELNERIKRYYGHWRDVLEGEVASPGFAQKEEEVRRTKQVVAYRDSEARRDGLGPQDAGFDAVPPAAG
jgi:hypothetical protein